MPACTFVSVVAELGKFLCAWYLYYSLELAVGLLCEAGPLVVPTHTSGVSKYIVGMRPTVLYMCTGLYGVYSCKWHVGSDREVALSPHTDLPVDVPTMHEKWARE